MDRCYEANMGEEHQCEPCIYSCGWANDDVPLIRTSCGRTVGARWVECGWVYCPYCGKKIKEQGRD